MLAGNRNAYKEFVAAQVAGNVHDILSFATFSQLSKHIQKLTQADYSLLQTATILSAVSLSKPAAILAQDAMLTNSIPDKFEFLSATLRKNSAIYPLLEQTLQNDDAAKKLLYILFPPQTNFRHMLYAENGLGMFKYLRTMIRHGFIDQNGLDLWYAYWIIDVSGYRGHIAQNGSLYLDNATALAMQKLYAYVMQMLETPNFDPLVPYLEYRAELLGLQDLPRQDKLFVAHLACILRIYDPKHGLELFTALQNINPKDLQAIKCRFFAGLTDLHQTLHLHVPALFGNVRQALEGDICKTLALTLPAYNKIIQQLSRQTVPSTLAFDDLARNNSLITVLQRKNFAVTTTADGTVLLN